MKRVLKWGSYTALALVGLIAIAAIGGYAYLQNALSNAWEPPTALEGVPSISSYAGEPAPADIKYTPLRPRQLDLQTLAAIDPAARPWARWWWPGGDVDAKQACEELRVMDARGIGGVEIQSFNIGLEPIEDEAVRAKINSFAKDDYYRTMSATMACAERLGMEVYLNHLSGWPAGGPQVLLEDGLHSLASGHLDVKGGQTVRTSLPGPEAGLNAYLLGLAEVFFGLEVADFPSDQATFLSAVAMRRTGGQHSDNLLDVTDTITLDSETAIVLDGHVTGDILEWDAPAGDWTIVATYILPSGEAPTLGAHDTPGFVLDHFRRDQVVGHYNWAFGNRTGLQDHYGKAFKGFFNDSLEFKVDRLAAHDILTEFEKRRGYDLRPHLPVVLVDVADNFFLRDVAHIEATPRYTLSDTDERVRHDYQQTLSDLVVERFLQTSANWAEARGLHSRGQSYGMDLDVIRALGANHIPEIEQLYAGGSTAFMKMAASAGALYDRPLITAESFVWIERDYTIAPRQVKAAADLLFASGVNQIIYHGIPYDLKDQPYKDLFGDIPWHPFSGPGNFSHFSENYGQGSIMWDAQPQLNTYLSRTQKLLQSGRPEVDVFIYYPWLGFPSFFDEMPGVTDDFLFEGYMPDAGRPAREKPGIDLTDLPFLKVPEDEADPRLAWLSRASALTRELDRRGVTWAWTNSHALETRGRGSGNGADNDIENDIAAVVVFETDQMELSTVKALESLKKQGTELRFFGQMPTRQSGFKDAKTGDEAVRMRIAKLSRDQVVSTHSQLVDDLAGSLTVTGNANVRRVRRTTGVRETVDFFTNLSLDDAASVVHVAGDDGLNRYWFDPMGGHVWRADRDNSGGLPLALGSLESVFLISTPQILAETGRPLSRLVRDDSTKVQALDRWTMKFGDVERKIDGGMIDLRTDEDLKYAAGPLVYRNDFMLQPMNADQSYVIDLGRVEGVATILVNGKAVGRASVHPFLVDISDAVRAGKNTITVSVRPPQRNALVGRALAGDKFAEHMSVYENDLVRLGLVDPVKLYRVEGESKRAAAARR
ncbi:glycosyl hydrolase [Parasphingorhabdus cellanae]|uniref:Glycoside hydrolase n=1 Tax=Parasphingorhabdus cellanae TaxID=2806553 RepID=A0ABX7T644_9SPHN|nr:glycosyl hydrolase [Parasphingorhabdus cellanae]QTD57079.1 hypothetical protein J4G78_05850 [Parasphingorhabdus cellanae]